MTPKRNRSWKFVDPIYHNTIILQHGSPEQHNRLCRKWGVPSRMDVKHPPDGRALWRDYTLLMWLPTTNCGKCAECLGIIAHEATHLTIAAMAGVNMPFEEATTEVFAYYTEFIVENVVKRLTKKGQRHGNRI